MIELDKLKAELRKNTETMLDLIEALNSRIEAHNSHPETVEFKQAPRKIEPTLEVVKSSFDDIEDVKIELGQLASAKRAAGKLDDVVKLMNKYGVKKLFELTDDVIPQFYNELKGG